ncbi:FAD-dependent monooxygenase [Streptomyces sp. NPDC058294]|uniref:FAD-dependent monooxygenase n=1 Tax=Streptomyces sp. NPDC058294 TaxID=3346430 RepID=UPI0036EBDCA5
MTHHNVLIAGAGIAGPALAHWLGRHGTRATVVERAPAPREGGQTVDLRGAGWDIARKMGLEHILRAHATREEGIRFVDAADRTKAASTSGALQRAAAGGPARRGAWRRWRGRLGCGGLGQLPR